MGLSQQALADRLRQLGVSISQTGVDKIEKRDTKRPKILREFALALGVSEEWILTGRERDESSRDRELSSLMSEIRELDEEQQKAAIEGWRAILAVARANSKKVPP